MRRRQELARLRPRPQGLSDDFSVAYHHVPRLFAALALGRADGRYTKMLRAIARLDLLILDDVDGLTSAAS